MGKKNGSKSSLNFQQKLFIKVLNKVIDYPFKNSSKDKTKYETVRLHIDIPKHLDKDMEAIINLIQNEYRDMDGYRLTKTKLIVSCLLVVLNLVVSPAGRVKRSYELHKTDGLKYEIEKRDLIESNTPLERKKK